MQAVGPSSLEGSLSGKEGGRRVRVREGSVIMEAEVRKMKGELLTKECWQPIETGKGKIQSLS